MSEIIEKEIYISISSPKKGTIVCYHGSRRVKPYDVYVEDGTFYSNGRMSNFWYWRKVNKDGSLGKLISGYGAFRESINKYKIEQIIKITKV
jgi:hypothetical protein